MTIGRLRATAVAVTVAAAVTSAAAGCGSVAAGARSSTKRPPALGATITTEPPPPGGTAPTTTTSAPASAPTTTSPPPIALTAPATTPATAKPAVSASSPPYRWESLTLSLVDHSRPTVAAGRQVAATRALTTLVWTPVGDGRWPLVIFAHGFQVGPGPYLALLESWAAAGFVVAAPEFPLTDSDLAGANLDESDITNQPADMRFVLDQLVAAGSPVAARIDAGRVAFAGHSDGAETALAASLEPVPSGEPAVRAVIAMSVSPLDGTAPTANPPLLVTQGDADAVNPPTAGYQTWAQAASPKYLAVLHGGGHLPPLEAGSAWLPGVERVTIDFLRVYLEGSPSPAALTADGTADAALLTVQKN